MSDQIDISIEADAWGEHDLVMLAQKALDAVREAQKLPKNLELSILACDDNRIASLNTEFRGKAKPTNVLSWPNAIPPQLDQDPFLGDIAIAFETCAREAKEQGKPLTDHLTHLLLHAILHLLGFDHETDAEAEQMETLETKILAKMGIDDPYSDSQSRNR